MFRYIPYAQDVAQGLNYDLGQDIRYAGYTSVIAGFLKAGLPYGYVVGLQVFLSLAALLLVQRLVAVITNSWLCSLIAALLVATSQDIQQWNFYVLTESIFTSTWVFCTAMLVLCRNRTAWVLGIPLWLFVCLVRPNGIFIIVAAAVYLFAIRFQTSSAVQRRKMLLGVGITAILFFLLLNQLLGPFTLVETYARGEIIYGTAYSNLTPPGSSMYRIEPPSTLQMPPTTASALGKLFLFFWHNPVFFLKLALVKGAVFIAFAKPYFSSAHNLFIFLTVYPCYLLSTQAFKNKRSRAVVVALFSLVGLQTLMVMFTVEDWDCRFMAPILPFIFMLGAIGLKQTVGRHFPAWDRIDSQTD